MENFSSLKELYVRLLPALKSKSFEMKREKMIGVSPDAIWDFFKENVWPVKTNLTLNEMVNDILNTDNLVIFKACRKEK